MIPEELAEQVRAEVKQLKQVQDQFLQTYKQLCAHFGGPEWRKTEEMVFHRVRREVIPSMEQAGLDPKAIQALCSWAEGLAVSR
jgi:hypothetical protein